MPQFEQRAIGFLDVLGFKDLVCRAEAEPAETELDELIAVLDSHVAYDSQTYAQSVPDAAKPKHLFISDSIIVSAPLQTGSINGLGSVVAKSIQIAHKLLEGGHLVRGGISIGSCWHGPTNIVGSGYIAAYEKEKTAGGPCIALDEAAAAYWRAHSILSSTNMCLDDGGELIADSLHIRYISNWGAYGRQEQAYDIYADWIAKRLSALPESTSPWRKWAWMRDFLGVARIRHGVGT